MEIEKSKVLVQFLLILGRSGDVLFLFLPVCFADILRQSIIILYTIFIWKCKQISHDIILCRHNKILKTSAIVDKAAFELLLTAKIRTFGPISNHFQEFFITFVAIFSLALGEVYPDFLKNLPGPSTAIVLSLTILESSSFKVNTFTS